MERSFWSEEAVRIMRGLHPGCEVEVLDQREMAPDEAWVCVRAGTGECVLGLRCLRRAPGSLVADVLYLHPAQAAPVPVSA